MPRLWPQMCSALPTTPATMGTKGLEWHGYPTRCYVHNPCILMHIIYRHWNCMELFRNQSKSKSLILIHCDPFCKMLKHKVTVALHCPANQCFACEGSTTSSYDALCKPKMLESSFLELPPGTIAINVQNATEHIYFFLLLSSIGKSTRGS
jgi:hypothetical protein